MAETMGAGALTGHFLTATLVSGSLQVADESLGTSVVADSDRAARASPSSWPAFSPSRDGRGEPLRQAPSHSPPESSTWRRLQLMDRVVHVDG
jgi:hypothetical protein